MKIFFCLFCVFFILPGCSDEQISFNLTNSEKLWLQNNIDSLFVVADPNFAPVEFIDLNGNYGGAASDFMEYIEYLLGVKFKRKFFNDWSEMITEMRNGNICIVQQIQKNKEREKYLIFTEPIINLSHIILVRKEDKFKDIKDLFNHKVAVNEEYAINDYLKANFPKLIIEPVPDIKIGLKSLALKECDAVICDLVTALYYIEKESIPNLRFISGIDYEYNLRIGINKKYPELKEIFSKVLKAIPEEKREEILNPWLKKDPLFYFIVSSDIKWLILFVSLSVALIIIVLIWNKLLQNKVKMRTIELEQAKLSLEEQVAERTKDLVNIINMRDKFYSIIAHDLKNPFLNLVAYSNILEEEYQSLNEEEKKEHIAIIADNIKKVYTLADQLLTWTRTQNVKFTIIPKKISINKYIEETIELISIMASKKSIKVNFDVKRQYELFADGNSVLTVLRNLLTNAVKYSFKNSEINIAIAENDDDIIISITDFGAGIPKERQSQIFDLDKISSTSGTNNEKGTGLGLQICKELIEKNNGRIWFESEENKGTVFFISLPKFK